MGWGEEKGRSAEMVRRSDLVRKADAMATAIHKFLDDPSGYNLMEELDYALTAYNEVRLLG